MAEETIASWSELMAEQQKKCSFCGVEGAAEAPLIAGQEGYICEACVECAHRVVSAWQGRRSLPLSPKVPSPRELKAKLDRYVVEQEEAKVTLAVAVYNHYQRLSSKSEGGTLSATGCEEGAVEIEKSNVLLLGPTGTGKTLLARTLAGLVGVPFAVADATTLTQAGYVGDDVDVIIHRLLEAAEGDVKKAEWGVVYIDEIDKICRRGRGPSSSRDVSGEGVQQALLKLVEGKRVSLPKRKPGDTEATGSMTTDNVLFIVGGAFEGIFDHVRARLAPPKSIGFSGAPKSVASSESTPDHAAAHVEHEDLRELGFIPEFIGRFPVLTCLTELSDDALVRVLTEPKNALTRQYRALFERSGAELVFTEEALRSIAGSARERKTGARGLRAIVEKLLVSTMFDLPTETPRRFTVRVVSDELAVDSEPLQREQELAEVAARPGASASTAS